MSNEYNFSKKNEIDLNINIQSYCKIIITGQLFPDSENARLYLTVDGNKQNYRSWINSGEHDNPNIREVDEHAFYLGRTIGRSDVTFFSEFTLINHGSNFLMGQGLSSFTRRSPDGLPSVQTWGFSCFGSLFVPSFHGINEIALKLNSGQISGRVILVGPGNSPVNIL